ncbi:unnamed protein product, partial [Mesorhabditis spiculigera]
MSRVREHVICGIHLFTFREDVSTNVVMNLYGYQQGGDGAEVYRSIQSGNKTDSYAHLDEVVLINAKKMVATTRLAMTNGRDCAMQRKLLPGMHAIGTRILAQEARSATDFSRWMRIVERSYSWITSKSEQKQFFEERQRGTLNHIPDLIFYNLRASVAMTRGGERAQGKDGVARAQNLRREAGGSQLPTDFGVLR